MNWGKGLALAMACFIGMMAFFFVKAAQVPQPLVTEDYYAEELVYQARIDAAGRANALEAPVSMQADRTSITVEFPASVREGGITGTLHLLRMNDEALDQQLVVKAGPDGRFTAATTLVTGPYRAQLDWTANGHTYYTETQLLVP